MESDEFKNRFLVFHRLIYRIAFGVSGDKEEAEDITQEVFEKLWNQRDALNAVKNDEAFIVTLSKNLAVDHVRRNCRHITVSLSGDRDIGSGEFIDVQLEGQETQGIVDRLMKTLPPKQQEAFRLRHFADLAIPQIAESMGQSEVNVRQLLSRARKTIREQIQRSSASVY